MAEDDVAASPPSDHKRKLQDLEHEAPQPPTIQIPVELDDAYAQETALVAESSASPDVKRPCLDDPSAVRENGYEDKNADEPSYGDKEQENEENGRAKDAETHLEDNKNASDDQKPAAAENNDLGDSEPSPVKNSQMNNTEEPSKEEGEPNTHNVSQQEDASMMQQQQETFTDSATISRKIEVPNDKVGILIGKGGDTVRFLQYNSGAKIQIVRDADADMACLMRPVELIGSLESISKAEKLIRDVITEAEAGGSPSLIARGFTIGQTAGDAEQFEMKVPNEKVGLMIGRGGDTIKGLQTRSGARIQLIPPQAGEGHDTERTIRVTGQKRQIDIAVEMIKDVMNQVQKPSHLSGINRQQANQSHGGPPARLGPPHGSPYPSKPMMGYDYRHQRGPFPSQNPQYPPSYNPMAHPHVAPRQSGYGFGWGQRPPPHDGNNNNLYGGCGPHAQALGPPAGAAIHGHGADLPPPQANYSYGPPARGPPPEYGLSGPYSSQAVPTHQGYGQSGYQAKYESAPPHHSYGTGSSQPAHSMSAPQSGYYMQQQHSRPPTTASYGMNTRHPPHSYGNLGGNQLGGGDAMTTYNPGSNQFYGSQHQVYPSSYPAASVLPPMQQQQQQQTTYPVFSTDGQGQSGSAAYWSYPSSVQQAAGYPTTEQQATTYHHQAAPATSHPQDPGAAAAVSHTRQQQAAGFTQQTPAAQTSYPQYDSATQHAYGGPPAAC